MTKKAFRILVLRVLNTLFLTTFVSIHTPVKGVTFFRLFFSFYISLWIKKIEYMLFYQTMVRHVSAVGRVIDNRYQNGSLLLMILIIISIYIENMFKNTYYILYGIRLDTYYMMYFIYFAFFSWQTVKMSLMHKVKQLNKYLNKYLNKML